MSMMTPGRNTPVFHQGRNLKYSIHVWQIRHRNVPCLERDCKIKKAKLFFFSF